MDGSSPSGFESSQYCGVTCTDYLAQLQSNVSLNDQTSTGDRSFDQLTKVPVNSMAQIFEKANSVGEFLALLLVNPWTLLWWFDFS